MPELQQIARDVEALAKSVEQLASEQERQRREQTIQMDLILAATEDVKTLDDNVANILQAIKAIDDRMVREALAQHQKAPQRGSFLSRLGDVLFYAGLLIGALGYWYGYNASNGFAHREDLGPVFIFSGLPIIVGWMLRYMLSGKTMER